MIEYDSNFKHPEDHYVLYWIHDINHTDITTEGYIGVTKNFKNRMISHNRWAIRYKEENHSNQRTLHKNILKSEKVLSTILLIGNKEYIGEVEEKLRPRPRIGWNAACGGWYNSCKFVKYSNERRKEISERSKKQIISEETKLKISNTLKGRTLPDEHREKIKEGVNRLPKEVILKNTRLGSEIKSKIREEFGEAYYYFSEVTSKDYLIKTPLGVFLTWTYARDAHGVKSSYTIQCRCDSNTGRFEDYCRVYSSDPDYQTYLDQFKSRLNIDDSLPIRIEQYVQTLKGEA